LSLSSGSESDFDDVPEVSDFLDFFSDSDSVTSELSLSELFDLFDLLVLLESDFDFSTVESFFDVGLTDFELEVELEFGELSLFGESRLSIGDSDDSVLVVDDGGLSF